ncbi:enoyl-CoA-hydratase DpgB [Actinomadura sp. NPDC047616]|uniref:enoyl-CoA-hydratase DpgB n=1 Tax=Actinomadura sp. NPDC047616 TaxID=3155914 RepID=UPI0033CD9DF3
MGDELVLQVDGSRPVTAASVDAVQALCDAAEDHTGPGVVTLHVSGVPEGDWTAGLAVGLVSKWERAVRRLERLGRLTVAVASGDVGGTALDVLLAADLRIADPGTRLLVARDGEATWPGMALYRLVQQAGTARVRRAALLGAPIGAGEALTLGLIDELAGDPPAALAEIAEQAAGLSGGELAIRRQLMFEAAAIGFEDALGAHLAACDRALRRAAH